MNTTPAEGYGDLLERLRPAPSPPDNALDALVQRMYARDGCKVPKADQHEDDDE